jgi:hypothetical protein
MAFDRSVAVGAVGLLVVVEEVAFIRHYTTTILSENLYVLTVALSLYALMKFVAARRTAWLAWSGFAAGISALIRPAMMLYLPLAILAIAALAWRCRLTWRHAALALAVFVSAWMAPVSLATVRNYLVAGHPVLISTTPAHSFVLYNLPPSGNALMYMEDYRRTGGGVPSAFRVLVRMAIEHPAESVSNVITKVGFSFGLLQWMGGHIHPELVLVSAGYLLAIVLLSAARAPVTWPIHAFVAGHLAGLVLTMPSNYGYRLLLPMYVFFPIFTSAVAIAALQRFPTLAGRLRLASHPTTQL